MSNLGGLGARFLEEGGGNDGGRAGVLIEHEMASNRGFKRRRWRGGDHGREDAGSSLEEGDEMTSSLASHVADRRVPPVSVWGGKKRRGAGCCLRGLLGRWLARAEGKKMGQAQ